MLHLVLPLRPLWHMGPLHPVEQLLTLLLAFGPFVVLGFVIWWRSRADAAEEAAEEATEAAAEEAAARSAASETDQARG